MWCARAHARARACVSVSVTVAVANDAVVSHPLRPRAYIRTGSRNLTRGDGGRAQCVCGCVCECVWVGVRACAHVPILVCASMCACTVACMCVLECLCVYARVRACVHARVCFSASQGAMRDEEIGNKGGLPLHPPVCTHTGPQSVWCEAECGACTTTMCVCVRPRSNTCACTRVCVCVRCALSVGTRLTGSMRGAGSTQM